MTKEMLNEMRIERRVAYQNFINETNGKAKDALWITYETLRDECTQAQDELAEQDESETLDGQRYVFPDNFLYLYG